MHIRSGSEKLLKQKLIVDLKILVILLSISASVSALAIDSSSKTAFSGAVYASPLIPIQGASVTASGLGGYGSAVTDSLGHYIIAQGLMTGNYTVTASATGYLKAEIENVAVTGGLVTSNISFLLNVSGAISGKVTDANSSLPLEGVIVTVNNATGYGISESAFTDVNGDYLVNTNLATGTYNVTASYSTGHVMNTISGIAVTVGNETGNVDLALEKSGIITGTVTDYVSSAPLQNIDVTASASGGIFSGFAVTNSSGQYRIDTNLATGTYNVSVLFPEGYVSRTLSGILVTAGAETTADLALNRSGIISGRVTRASNGQPVAEASITAYSGGFAYFSLATTNATGYYRMSSGLGTGIYTVMASFGLAFNMTSGVNVIAGSETSDVNMMLDITPSGTITGRVTNSTGFPLEFASVHAEGLAGSGDTVTDSNGNYTISTGLGTGTYTVNASAAGYSMMSVSDVSVTIDQVTSNVDFQLSTILSGAISGTVEAEFPAIPEFLQPIFAFLFAASLIAVTFARLHKATIRRTKPS